MLLLIILILVVVGVVYAVREGSTIGLILGIAAIGYLVGHYVLGLF